MSKKIFFIISATVIFFGGADMLSAGQPSSVEGAGLATPPNRVEEAETPSGMSLAWLRNGRGSEGSQGSEGGEYLLGTDADPGETMTDTIVEDRGLDIGPIRGVFDDGMVLEGGGPAGSLSGMAVEGSGRGMKGLYSVFFLLVVLVGLTALFLSVNFIFVFFKKIGNRLSLNFARSILENKEESESEAVRRSVSGKK